MYIPFLNGTILCHGNSHTNEVEAVKLYEVNPRFYHPEAAGPGPGTRPSQ
jgi:hypothetical protein